VQHGHGMASVNQTQPHCVNKMGKTHSERLVAWHGHGVLRVNWPLVVPEHNVFIVKDQGLLHPSRLWNRSPLK
jgi:hypothetical protein